jgi:hypothetical protein
VRLYLHTPDDDAHCLKVLFNKRTVTPAQAYEVVRQITSFWDKFATEIVRDCTPSEEYNEEDDDEPVQ